MRSRRRPAPRRWHNRPGWRPARTAGWLTWTGRPDSATFARPVLKEVPGGGWFRTGQAVGGHVLPAGISAAAAAAPDLAEGVAGLRHAAGHREDLHRARRHLHLWAGREGARLVEHRRGQDLH